MILGGCLIGLVVGLMNPKKTDPKKQKPKKRRPNKKDDDFWDYAWS